MATLTINTDEKTAENFYTFCEELGLDMSTAITLFMKACLREQKIPFELKVAKKEIVAYIKNKYRDELEFLWEKSPKNAVVRRKSSKKWYAVILTVSKRKLNLDSDEIIEVINLHNIAEEIKKLIDYKKYFPAYHMNKKHWCTICLDRTVELKEIYKLIDVSYELAK